MLNINMYNIKIIIKKICIQRNKEKELYLDLRF